MILPDIRKCSNLVQNMVANRYSCFWGLGAIWQPLWLKNSHNMAIFHHFLTFSVTFLVAMTSFMHKTCTERTETFLIHRTIDEVPFFAISRHLSRGPGAQKGYFMAKSRPKWQGWLQAGPAHLESVRCAISHPNGWDSMTWGHFRHFQAPIQGSRGPKMAILWLNPGSNGRGCSRLSWPTWKVSGAPYHIPMDGRV